MYVVIRDLCHSYSIRFLICCLMLVPLQEDPDTIDRLIADAEASYNKWRHPDPYIGKLTTLPTLLRIYPMPHCFLSLSIGNYNISHP